VYLRKRKGEREGGRKGGREREKERERERRREREREKIGCSGETHAAARRSGRRRRITSSLSLGTTARAVFAGFAPLRHFCTQHIKKQQRQQTQQPGGKHASKRGCPY